MTDDASTRGPVGSPLSDEDRHWLAVATGEARTGRDEGGIPIGAALVTEGRLLASGRNRRVQLGSAIRHGETDCIENAGRLPAETYQRSVLYITLSPCFMFAGTVLLYGIPRMVIGENTTFQAAEDLLREHGVEVSVAQDSACLELMQSFARDHPELWWEDTGETGPWPPVRDGGVRVGQQGPLTGVRAGQRPFRAQGGR